MKCIEAEPYSLSWSSSCHCSHTAKRIVKEKDSSPEERTLYTRHPSFDLRMSGA